MGMEGESHTERRAPPARRCPDCPGCYVDVSRVACILFLFAMAATILGVAMQLYLYLNIDATTKFALRKFVDCTASVQSGIEGLSQEVAALRGRVVLMEQVLLANLTAGFRAFPARD